jgi:TetR/AcrR family transcriptional repressor of nem operon
MPKTAAPRRHAGRPETSSKTAVRILDAAERLVQERGYNAFSYADVANELGIRKASLHHHFATKADLGLALIVRYRRAFMRSLRGIDSATEDALERLQAYRQLYASVLRRNRMCLCGMLASDAATLPKGMRTSLTGFFDENEAWLARVLEEGRARGLVRFTGPASAMATFFVSSLEGAMLIARGSGRRDDFDRASESLLAQVEPDPAPARRRSR